MLIKKAVYKNVKVIQREIVSDAIYGCDECECEIKDYPNEQIKLELTVFYKDNNKETKDLHFCSWDCVLLHIPKIDSDDFVDLPILYYDEPKESKRSAQHLIDILNNSGLSK